MICVGVFIGDPTEAPRIRYQTYELPGLDLHVRTLRDKQQFSDDDGEAAALGISSAAWPIFGVVWDSSLVLADLMSGRAGLEGCRILEVGCGIGLASLVLSHRGADITATDRHPEAGRFLAENVALNNFAPVPFVREDWGGAESALGTFDLIVGSDVLYDRDRIKLLADFVARHAKPTSELVFVDPGRGNLTRFAKLLAAHGFTCEQERVEAPACLNTPFKGRILYCHSDGPR